ncbi:unnamed protein product [Prorocentrum cordatum]|uniref:Uncharacterized protein n=1 Tax=Prorocentrum cordatum TaxID=2364126 RepID=A0ABN9SB72_9DINO|nr:unnamed protein product [Polarella glacialis]
MALATIAARVHHLVMLQLMPTTAVPYSPQAVSSLLEYASEGGEQAAGRGGVTSTYDIEDKSYWAAIGMKNKVGVTRYQNHEFQRVQSTDGTFFWSDAANHNGSSFRGARDLGSSVAWGWHHPAGVYSTIPVGSPLLDDQLNVYIGADDAIRKFDVSGVIMWSYAPRGQLAAAPSLCTPTARRVPSSVHQEGGRTPDSRWSQQEDLLRPDWAKDNASEMPSLVLIKDFQIGDLVEVKPGASYRAEGTVLSSGR